MTGVTLRDAARRFGLSKDSVSRHKAHVSQALATVVAEREQAGARSALDRLEDLYDRASRVLDAAESEGKATLTLQAVKELRGIVETLAKVTGELDESPKVAVLNVASSAEWVATRAAMLDALQPYPEAARAVAARLVELEAGAR